MWILLQVLTNLNPQKESKETKDMHIGSPSSILKFWPMSPLATWVLHCPYAPEQCLPLQEDQHEVGHSYGMMPTHTQLAVWVLASLRNHARFRKEAHLMTLVYVKNLKYMLKMCVCSWILAFLYLRGSFHVGVPTRGNGVCPRGWCLPRGVSAQWSVFPGGCLPGGGVCPWRCLSGGSS